MNKTQVLMYIANYFSSYHLHDTMLIKQHANHLHDTKAVWNLRLTIKVFLTTGNKKLCSLIEGILFSKSGKCSRVTKKCLGKECIKLIGKNHLC